MAQREGLSLSAWLRKAGNEKLLLNEQQKPIYDKESLERFFLECDAHDEGTEPDWEDHLKVINRSRASGQADL
ncbi:antitoxin [Nitrospira sp. M1]